MVYETHAQLASHYTNDALRGKSVVVLYFSADWCGQCPQFTPELVSFYNKMIGRRGKVNTFEIVWISRCRDFDSVGQYFTHMNWLAMQPEDAMGQRGQMLSDKYKVKKGIPSMVLLDDLGNLITTDGRNKIHADKAGIGFPWRNPIARVYMTILLKSLRLMLKSQIKGLTGKIVGKIKGAVGLKPASA
jgi:thiol-disulfide isomerase/thioredoxin